MEHKKSRKNKLPNYVSMLRVKSFCAFAVLLFTLYSADAQSLKVGLVPIGKVDEHHINIVKAGIENFYRAEVSCLLSTPMADSLLSTYSDPKRVSSISVINAKAVNLALAVQIYRKYDMVVGLTDSALTIGKRLMSERILIRGLAADTLKTATISTFKLKHESVTEEIFIENLTKVARHEIAHVLGLRHCYSSDRCLMLNGMKFKNTIPEFCSACLEKIDNRLLR
ncbi:MAG: hypothetical protein AAF992_23675 [Bacteroidota bacterium]